MQGTVLRWTEEPRMGASKRRTAHTITGIGVGWDYGVQNNSYANIRRGLLERVCGRVIDGKLTQVPRPRKGVYDKLKVMANQIVENMPPCRRLSRREFVELYSGRRRTVFENAVTSLATRPVCIADSYLSTFVKGEKINFTLKPDPASRVIQPRSARMNVELGRFVKLLERGIKDAMAKLWGGPTIMKGYNASETGVVMHQMWSEFRQPVALPIDAVRFDQHVDYETLEWEHSVYLKCFKGKNRIELARLLSWQIQNRGFARTNEGNIKYTVLGRRMSGDMNTGMGNCLIMCALMLQMVREARVKARLANNGDDCVLIMERPDVERVCSLLPRFFLDHGFVLEVEKPVYVFEQISFCQTQPVLGPDGTYVMVRDPRVAIDKDLTTLLPMDNEQDLKRWAYNMGMCNLALGRGMPLWQSLAQSMIKASHGLKRATTHEMLADSGMFRLAQRMSSVTAEITPETRVSFWRAFGILPDLQVACESHLDDFRCHFAVEISSPLVSPLSNLKYLFSNDG